MNLSTPLVDWLLESMEFDSSLFHLGRYCGGWHTSTHGMARSSFHLVVQGGCWLHLEGDEQAHPLNVGDSVFLLRDVPYRLSSAQLSADVQDLPRMAMTELDNQARDGVGLVCGFFHFKSGLSSLIIEGLPNWIILRSEDPSSKAARALFEMILEECKRQPAPSSAMLESLSQLMFRYVLRQELADNQNLGGLVALARHSQFAPLLDQLIKQPQNRWSLETMAASTGLSRSAFFKRFNELAGQSPGQVLLALRIRHACQLLRNNQTVEQACAAVGYQSIAAFTRAFAKAMRMQPGAYRKQHEGR
ncbi:cupin domain-containing protein [Pseudomonas siliginis]|uniref:AraC family transcriptional regulator n=1 Tax=Pseudomonas siliginis TaxID=2842346 RepID=UPI00386EF0FD